ncbi:hypothetical protein OEZ85_010175 [Tetradesmus obliquus]|uniref:DNA 3'-5' helicase n=1 Tax=Tetradesmus obliquus TaxID=3088 RepID=A0ABY8TR82_TETOB|nr:hypothetical protein OEZ85_010175 [Tetradesmus obliquus]
MDGEPRSPVAVVGSVGAPGAQPRNGSSSIGAVGQLSTPELLAKRLQRQQAEREALAGLCSRPNLARRLLQPLQQPQQQHAHAPHQGSAAGPGSSAVNKLSRAAKRPLAAPKPSAMEPEQPTGVSADELAKKRKRPAAAAAEGEADGEAAAAAKKSAKKAAGAAVKKPRTKKTAHRQNFKRHTHNGGYSFKFVSKSAVHAHSRRFRRVTKSGRLIMARRQAPHMAGQGAEFVDGFAGGASGGGTSGKGRCFKCGQAGHWAADCPLIAASIAAQEAEMAEWRTAQDEKEAGSVAPAAAGPTEATAAAAAAGEQGGVVLQGGLGGVWMPQQQPASYNGYREQQAAAAAAAGQAPAPQQPAWPLPLSEAELKALAGVAADAPWQPELLSEAQLQGVLRGVWGHEGFRGQQLPLVRSALAGRSMLGVLPTGLGKSLTYQLPALLLQGLVVVVSPLLALMRDQLQRLPQGLPGAMLQGSMSRQEVEQVLGCATAGQLRLLYVAPEKLSARPVMECLRGLSPLPLVCVDEAHCMAEWGQGFRPAYFRLGHLLCNVLRPRAVLALTATATPVTRACIRQLLDIPPEQQLIESPLRSNLRLGVSHVNGASKGGGIAAAVVQLLTTGELASAKSVVVYAGFKATADSLAAQLQRAAVPARPYHAGLTMQQREAVQGAFLSGGLRVVVATVAFGMGVDKQDLDAVLHTCLPHSLEEYVQQVGRAGRDGRVGRCMLFLDDADYVKLRALAHGGTARRCSIELFLAKVFGRELEYEAQQDASAAADGKKRRKQPNLDPSRHRALPVQAAAAELDVAEEVMEGCLSFLQADAVEPFITALPNTAATIDVRFHKTAPEQLAEQHPVVAAILKAKCRKYAGTYKVHMPALLAAADRPPGELLAELAGLAAAHEVGLDLGRQGALAWRLERQPADWQALVGDMAGRLEQVRHATVCRLDRCYTALAGAAVYSSQAAQERHMRAVINEYFMDEPPAAEEQQQQDGQVPCTSAAAADGGHDAPAAAGAAGASAAALAAELGSAAMVQCMQSGEMPWGGACPIQRPSRESLGRQMRAALRSVWARAQDLGRDKFTGLALARLLAGLASPAVPASTWKGSSEWGRLAAVDFRLMVEVGEAVVEEHWQQQAASQAQNAQLLRQR